MTSYQGLDREPQPTDGPDYHADHAAWEWRQRHQHARGGHVLIADSFWWDGQMVDGWKCACHKVWPPHPFIPHPDGSCWYCSKSAAEHAPYLDR